MVKYTYDAWGNHTITDYTEFGLGSINPFRYRSYYYDTETGLYYLKSRYYDPQTGRFINIDDISYLDPETIGGANLYAYCLNNPVKYVDPKGKFVISTSAVLLGALFGLIVGVGTVAYNDYRADGVLFNGNNWDYLFYGLAGAITGAIGGVFAKAKIAIQFGVSIGLGATTSIVEGYYTGEITKFWSLETLLFVVSGAITSALSFIFTAGITKMATRLKYNSIIGNNTSNHHINQALSKAGFGNLKIGREGIKIILDEISETSSIKFLDFFSGSLFDFITGVI